MNLRMLNIGCGSRFHPDFVNVDLVAYGLNVLPMDIRKGIAFPDGSFDVVYHSHLLEHIPPDRALSFLEECARVLVEDGVVRVAVPDLEQIARDYLRAVDEVASGAPGAEDRYSWLTLELLDQMTRSQSGGRIANFARQASPEQRRFIVERWGIEGQRLWQDGSKGGNKNAHRQQCRLIERIGMAVKNQLMRLILGETYPAYQACIFRSRGEVHQWMYDRFSLKFLLVQAGFVDVKVTSAASSYVAGWKDFNLDTEPDGTIYKPYSLFMEGRKRSRGRLKEDTQ